MKTLLRCMLASASLCIAVPLGAQKQHKAVPIVTPAPSLSSEAQLALDEISPRFATEIEQIKGWFRERPVLYYNFGFVNEPVTAGRVFWPIYGFDAKGNPISGDVTDKFILWDAGTEVDEEIGIGPNQGPRQKGPNTGADEHGVVSRVKDARWTGKNAEFFRVTITLEAGM